MENRKSEVHTVPASSEQKKEREPEPHQSMASVTFSQRENRISLPATSATIQQNSRPPVGESEAHVNRESHHRPASNDRISQPYPSAKNPEKLRVTNQQSYPVNSSSYPMSTKYAHGYGQITQS